MFRKAFLTLSIVVFCLSTVIGCAKPASKAQPTKKPATTTEKSPAAKADAKKAEPEKKADAKIVVEPAAQAPPSVSE